MASSTIKQQPSVNRLTLSSKATDTYGSLILSELGTGKYISIVGSRLITDDTDNQLCFVIGNSRTASNNITCKLMKNIGTVITSSISVSGYIDYVSFT